MPPGTPPERLLAAATIFAREEFALQHRYALALHTDEPHPHVHLAVKALSEEGKRLNIRKSHLRMWRSEFARHLREQGVRANATDRMTRGVLGRAMPEGKFRAAARGALRDTHKDAQRLPNGPPGLNFAQSPAYQDVVRGWRRLLAPALAKEEAHRARAREIDPPTR
jgi:hypothetical protein